MPYYEVIYETGAHSVLFAENDIGIQEGLSEQHRRALNGGPGQLASSSSKHPSHDVMHGAGSPVPIAAHMAERVKRVLVYEDHPGDAANFDMSPRVDPANKHPHHSNYVVPEARELELEWLPGNTPNADGGTN